MERTFVSYFNDLFTSSMPTDVNINEILDNIHCKITPQMNDSLSANFTKEEITTALNQMHPSKAPSSDEFPTLFTKSIERI